MLIGILIFSSCTPIDYAPSLEATGVLNHTLPYSQMMEGGQKKGLSMC